MSFCHKSAVKFFSGSAAFSGTSSDYDLLVTLSKPVLELLGGNDPIAIIREFSSLARKVDRGTHGDLVVRCRGCVRKQKVRLLGRILMFFWYGSTQ